MNVFRVLHLVDQSLAWTTKSIINQVRIQWMCCTASETQFYLFCPKLLRNILLWLSCCTHAIKTTTTALTFRNRSCEYLKSMWDFTNRFISYMYIVQFVHLKYVCELQVIFIFVWENLCISVVRYQYFYSAYALCIFFVCI